MSIFDNPPVSRRQGCPVCGDRNEMRVIVRADELGAKGQVVKGTRNVTYSRSFCLKHGQAIFLIAHGVLDGASERLT